MATIDVKLTCVSVCRHEFTSSYTFINISIANTDIFNPSHAFVYRKSCLQDYIFYYGAYELNYIDRTRTFNINIKKTFSRFIQKKTRLLNHNLFIYLRVMNKKKNVFHGLYRIYHNMKQR